MLSSAALLALAVTVCTGSIADGATARALMDGGTRGMLVESRHAERVASLLSCLSEAARQFYKQRDRAAGPVEPIGARDAAVVVEGVGTRVGGEALRVSARDRVGLSLLNLPPPTM